MSCHDLPLPRPNWHSEGKEAEVKESIEFNFPRFRLGQIRAEWVSRDESRMASL